MIKLKYKTRENTSPQGKPRVYFCCHPEDFSKYFETVANEVLEKQNCTIWYVDEDTSRDDEFFGDLKQMQLFVMPVTTNLLCSPNVALDSEFKFAVENHIPVLPLMQENGLEKLFNEKCGDLQFLDKHNVDSTAIGYDEKLQKYLETVLIGDELAEKIRAAFDAYVFLSYRKKDRRYAQELMRLIHKNEFCRDIAIWYDEFLTPGENFNDSIKKALQKSGLFVLTVTPNLINEQNYVMTTEYPMARQEGKPVLPAELVPTDRGILSEKYADIPDPTNAYNDVELSEALLDSIKRMNIKENDISPEHNFFIGLAYLGGVDVEVDYERAVELISKAADEGLPEAMKKLVVMYSKGFGVKRDIPKAVEWQNRFVSVCEHGYKNAEISVEIFLKELWLLGSLFNKIYNFTKAKATYEKILSTSSTKIDRDDSTEEIVYYFCLACNNLGSFYYGKDKNQAFAYYNRVLEICDQFQDLSDRLKQQKSVSYLNMGVFCEEENEIDAALEYYKSSLEVRRELFNADNIRTVKDMYLCYHNISLCYERGNDLHLAIEFKLKTIELQRIVLNKARDPYEIIDGLSSLVDSYIALSARYLEFEQKNDAKQYMKEACTIIGAYYSKLKDTFHEYLYAKEGELLFRAGETYEKMLEYDTAREFYRKSSLRFSQAFQKTRSSNDRYRCAVSISAMAGIERKLGKINKAREIYTEAIEVLSYKTLSITSDKVKNGIAVLLFNAATVDSRCINRDYLAEACLLWEELYKRNPRNKQYLTYYKKAKEILDAI